MMVGPPPVAGGCIMIPKPDTLEIAGLPPLSWERAAGWRCEAELPAWAGFTPRFSEDQPPGEGPPTGRQVSVLFACPDISERTPPSAGQIVAYQGLVAGGTELRDAILQAIFDEYRDTLAGNDRIPSELGGPLAEPPQLMKLIALIDVSIDVDRGRGETSVEFEFDCVWDPDGFIATVTGGRVMYVGAR
jgi:hypothetical protein